MSVLKRYNGTDWETVGPPPVSQNFDNLNNITKTVFPAITSFNCTNGTDIRKVSINNNIYSIENIGTYKNGSKYFFMVISGSPRILDGNRYDPAIASLVRNDFINLDIDDTSDIKISFNYEGILVGNSTTNRGIIYLLTIDSEDNITSVSLSAGLGLNNISKKETYKEWSLSSLAPNILKNKNICIVVSSRNGSANEKYNIKLDIINRTGSTSNTLGDLEYITRPSSKVYIPNDVIQIGGRIAIVTDNISVGDDIVIGENIEWTTIGNELNKRNPIVSDYLFNNGDIYGQILIDSKIQEYTNIINDSTEGENFIFYTDPHFGNNDINDAQSYCMTTLQKYYNSTPTDLVICGGDWLYIDDTQELAKKKLGYIDGFTKKMFNGKHYMVLGNHDYNYYGSGRYGSENFPDLPLQTIINLLFREYNKAYYSFNGLQTKFYVIDYGIIETGENWGGRYPNEMTSYRWEQIDWLGKELIKDDAKHSALMTHNWTDGHEFCNQLRNLIRAYNNHTTVTLNSITYDFTNCTGRLEFGFAGHWHSDSVHKIVDNNKAAPIITTTRMYDIEKSKTPTFDIVRIDYTNRLLYCIRVGDGENRTFSLDTGNIINS